MVGRAGGGLEVWLIGLWESRVWLVGLWESTVWLVGLWESRGLVGMAVRV